MTRGEMYSVYTQLTNSEKRGIAEELGYSNCQGLVRFLSYNPSETLEVRYTQSLIKVIGMERLISIKDKDKDILFECKKQLIKEILNTDDIEVIRETQRDIEEACKGQILRLESIAKIG